MKINLVFEIREHDLSVTFFNPLNDNVLVTKEYL